MSSAFIKHKAQQLGYSACGIIPASAFDEYRQHLDERIKQFPKSKELYEPLWNLVQPPKDGKSIIVCTRGYNKYKIPDSLNGLFGKVYLFDGRLSHALEYRAKLEFEASIQTLGIHFLQGDVPARWAAAKAGLGKFGRNNFIYHPDHGSYFWIDTWIVDQELDFDAIAQDTFLSKCKEGCKKCIRSCPTKALSDSFSMDRGKCIAHLSFYAKNIPDETTRSQMGLWQYGCDVCQDVCPLNKGKLTEKEAFPQLSEIEEALRFENLLEMDEDTYLHTIFPRFWYAGEDALWLWKCNALRGIINSGDSRYHHLIQRYRNHADARLRELAEWGCCRIGL